MENETDRGCVRKNSEGEFEMKQRKRKNKKKRKRINEYDIQYNLFFKKNLTSCVAFGISNKIEIYYI